MTMEVEHPAIRLGRVRAKQKRRLPSRIIAHKLSYTRRTLSLEVTMRMRGISQALLRD